MTKRKCYNHRMEKGGKRANAGRKRKYSDLWSTLLELASKRPGIELVVTIEMRKRGLTATVKGHPEEIYRFLGGDKARYEGSAPIQRANIRRKSSKWPSWIRVIMQ